MLANSSAMLAADYYKISSVMLTRAAHHRTTTQAMMLRTYRAFGISCDHCKDTIEAAVGFIDGVQDVQVDVDTKTIRVVGDASDEEIRAAITAAGYEVADAV